jgi:quercetin dioxygenase-like cupin family protein
MPFGGSFELSEGSLGAVDAGRVHEVEALQDCAFILTLAWPPTTRREGGGGETGGSGI